VTRGLRSQLLVKVVGVYLLCRLFSGALIAWASGHQAPVSWTGPHPNYLSMTVLWDGSWYRYIAEHGYPTVLPVDHASGHVGQNPWAFYPAFPLLSRLFTAVTGLGFPVVASTFALVSGVGAAVLMAMLLRDRVGPRVALAAVAVFAAFMASPVLQIAYTEGLAMLLLCGYLLAIGRERWLIATALALAIGLTRPIAVPLTVVTLVAVWLRWRRRHEDPIARPEWLAALSALAGCAVAGLIWPALAWWVTGSRTAYTDTMAAWRAGGTITPVRPWLDMSRYLFGDTWGPVSLSFLGVGLLVMLLGPWASGLGPELRVWPLAYAAYLVAVLDPWTSVFRYLLPLFPVAVVMVGGGWRERPARWLRLRTGVFVALGLLGQVWWVWELLRFVPPSDYPP
jgi:hypothetical protein